MHKKGHKPSSDDYIQAARACAAEGQHKKMMEVFRIAKYQDAVNDDVFAATVEGFRECGRPREALEMIETMKNMGYPPTPHTLNTILATFAECQQKDGMLAMYERMKEDGVTPSHESYHFLAGVSAQEGDIAEVAKILDEMERNGVKRDATTFSFLLGACARKGDDERALKILKIMDRSEIEPDQACLAEAITALGIKGRWEEAEQLFEVAMASYEENEASTLRLYFAMSLVMVEAKQLRRAYRYYKELLSRGLFQPLSHFKDIDLMVLDLQQIPHPVLPVAVKSCFDGLREDWLELKRRQRTESGPPPRFPPLRIKIPPAMDLSESRSKLVKSFGIKSEIKSVEGEESLFVTSDEVLMWLRRGLE